MSLKKRIISRAANIDERDLNRFHHSLLKLDDIVTRFKEKNQNMSILECVDTLYYNLFGVVDKSQSVDKIDFFRYICLDNMLKSKNLDHILKDAIKREIYKDPKSEIFNGNQAHDIDHILIEYFNFYYKYRLLRLEKQLEIEPDNEKLRRRINEIKQEKEKLIDGSFSVYEENKFIENQKVILEKLYKKCRLELETGLRKGVSLKILLLDKMKCFEGYVAQYNKMLERMSLSSILRVDDSNELLEKLVDEKFLSGLSVSELVALNAFWTNRLAKEVENLGEAVYILRKTGKLEDLTGDTENLLSELEIRSGLAEYRTIAPYITEYKLDRRKDMKNVHRLEDDRFLKVDVEVEDLFTQEEIDEFGKDKLKTIIEMMLPINNYTQLLYDQKDIFLEDMIVNLLVSNNYQNAGLIIDEINKSHSKSLIGVDLKGFNAPILLHYHKNRLEEIVSEVKGNKDMPIYRGARDFKNSVFDGSEEVISTNLLFPISKEQKMKLAKRAQVISNTDDNNRYVKHILWMYKPKKEMPQDIYEEESVIDLETGQIAKLNKGKEK